MTELDQRLQDRYKRAYDIICNLPVGDKLTDLIIDVAHTIALEEERIKRASETSDFGSVGDKEEEAEKAKAQQIEADEEEAWANTPGLDLPKEEKTHA